MIGSNIFRDIRNIVGPDQARISTDPTLGPILALYEATRAEKPRTCHVRVVGEKPVLIPARSLKILEATTRPAPKGESYCAMVEESLAFTGPRGLALGRTIVEVQENGRIPIQVANFGEEDFCLAPRSPVGVLTEACLPPEVQVSEIQNGTVNINTAESQTTLDQEALKGLMERVTVGDGLLPEQKQQLEEVIGQYRDTFSESEEDIGFCDKIEHQINLTDSIPVKVPHRRIPPHQWPEVREYLQQSLKTGVIRVLKSICFPRCPGTKKMAA